MIPLIRSFVLELLYSPEAARVWFRSFLAWASGVGAQVVAAPPGEIAKWTLKDWVIRCAIAGVLGFALMLKAGEKNAKGGLTPLEPK
jgi:hypothetical protein